MSSREVLLEVKDVSVDYSASNGAVHAVDHASFTLHRGEIIGLAGESGSGKSTLAYAIARLLRPPAMTTGGEVLYYPRVQQDGSNKAFLRALKKDKAGAELGPVDILELTPAQLRTFRWNELSIVFQSAMNALNPVMTVGKQIMDVLEVHQPSMGPDARKKRAIELLRRVGIAADRLNSYPHELSGGMRQRATIAIALALNPELIIMDEPTTALDVVVQREILDMISELCQEFNMALIFITHDLSMLLELVDRIAIMYAGRLIEMADRDAMFEHPRHPYSYGLLNSFPRLHGPRRRMVGIPGSPPDLRNVPAGCPFHERCPLAFEACHTVRPSLQPAVPEIPGQLVSCHLYTPTLTPDMPSTAELAASYEALAERSKVR
ncbi:ABC transporter ATP-binding protein [Dictyobacter kobayashii]|uniref:Dipeptide/oligopeptide/nickel ABC transporter ATP-binding protein n=1 Tax=Dictyobacter kobayashii TaxID=2014872 RepID=A0A402AUF7_9CHLR|nr:ABC transporter ATP-binding protein [Dictyobacter kobayashii]GCE22663.1 dipeptide/oligopeptide/nickel ABC transporter ATP-binding protein [Dictyobacter kobayashii]